jgi:hypothetical protein
MTARKGRPNATGRSSGKIGGKRGKRMKPPKDEPWVWFTREMIESDAWASLGINARRVLDCLLLDHMAHAGTENGALKATYKQLQVFGVGARFAADAIREVEAAGFIDCHRGGMRVATTYRLTWLPTKDDEPATNRWKQFGKRKSASQRAGSKDHQGKAEASNLPHQGNADAASPWEGPSIFTRQGGEAAPSNPSGGRVVPLRANGHASASSCPTIHDPSQIDLEEAIVAKTAGRQP